MDEKKIAVDFTLIEVAETIVSNDTAVNGTAPSASSSALPAPTLEPASAPSPATGSAPGATSGQATLKNTMGTVGVGFEVLGVLGEGAMGTVYKARHLLLDKIFAVKVLKEEFTSQSRVFLRFQNEARTTSQLSHENIASVHDFGLTESGHPYIVMDFVDGLTLADLIESKGALPQAAAISIFKQIGLALAHAHEKGVVHRDLKPSNIILTRKTSGEWQAKVVDFGIAKVTLPDGDSASPKLTQTGEVFGTPLYMSPEQCQGGAVDNRSDIYSFGCLMYEVLVGVRPFAGENTFALLLAHVNQAPQPFREKDKNVRVSDVLERIVFRAMEKDPEDRYQSVETLLADLEAVDKGGTVAPSKQYSKPRQKKNNEIIFGSVGVVSAVCVFYITSTFGPIVTEFFKAATSPWAIELSEGRNIRAVDLQAAEAHFRKAIAIAEKAHATPRQLSVIRNELAILLFMKNGPQHEVYKLFSQVAKDERQDNLVHTNSLDYLARCELAESKRIEEQAAKAKDSGAAPQEVANLLARVTELRKQAIEHATEAVDLKIKFSSPENDYVENALRSKGWVLYGEEMYPEAEKEFSKALAIAEKLNLSDAIGQRCLDLARCSVKLGKPDTAKQYYERSVKQLEEVFGSDNSQTREAMAEYQKFLRANGEKAPAEK